MPEIVNPMDALPSFQLGVMTGEIWLERGQIDRNVHAYLDDPEGGSRRWSYARLDGKEVTSLAILTRADPYEGKHCLQIGYAVPEHLRGEGRGKDIAQAAINEARYGMARAGVKAFYVEAIVGAENIASQRVASSLFGSDPKPITDQASGKVAFQYMTLIEADPF